jgi:hypothetical protein
MRRTCLALLLLTAPLSAAHAQSMTAGQFLAKAETLQKKGMMAMFSSDLGLLKKEIQASGKILRARQQSEVKAGRRPAYCLPDKAPLNSDELLAHLRRIPAAQRGMSFQAAFEAFVKKKFPCP